MQNARAQFPAERLLSMDAAVELQISTWDLGELPSLFRCSSGHHSQISQCQAKVF